METVGVEPTPPRCKQGARPIELHPQVRTGGVESRYAQRYACLYTAESSPMLSVRKRKRCGSPRFWTGIEDHDLGCCCYTTTTMSPMPASPASADHRLVGTEIERREIIMAREAGRIFRRRADVRIRTGTSRITTSDAAVTPRPPSERGRPDSNRRVLA